MSHTLHPNPLAAANLVYDQLADKLKFRRVPGTRERLLNLGLALVRRDPDAAHHILGFSRDRQTALIHRMAQIGEVELGEILVRQASNANCGGSIICDVPFHYWEIE